MLLCASYLVKLTTKTDSVIMLLKEVIILKSVKWAIMKLDLKTEASGKWKQKHPFLSLSLCYFPPF